MSENRSEISQLGEFGLIDRIREKFTLSNPSSLTGIGDDAAVIDGGEECMLISTDMLVEDQVQAFGPRPTEPESLFPTILHLMQPMFQVRVIPLWEV